MDLISLKSGSDIRGVACGDSVQLTDEAVRAITGAFVRRLCEKTEKPAAELRVAVGHDCRTSADRLRACVLSALIDAGVNAFDCGLSSTPAMFMAVIENGLDASIQLTASHMPQDRNGLKFFDKNGGFDGGEITEILARAKTEPFPRAEAPGRRDLLDFMPVYCAGLREKIRTEVGGDLPLAGLHIVVDAGNGVGGFFATEVLAKLGADISGSVLLEPDGTFPVHIPNPENADAMACVRRAVSDAKADLGLIFDTDVDRAACVDASGEEIGRDALIALSAVVACGGRRGCTIVTDSVTTDGLRVFLETQLGARQYRYRRGYKNVIDKARELCAEGIDCPLAIETSGHAALRENYFLDDGAYLMTRITALAANLRRAGKTVGDLIAAMPRPAEEAEKRYRIAGDDFGAYGDAVIASLAEYAETQPGWTICDDNREGIRVRLDADHGDGWFLLRKSVHDPVLPFNCASRVKGGCALILSRFNAFIEQFDRLS